MRMEPQWDVSVHSGTPLFRSVRGVPLSTGPPHHDKVTGPRVREGVEARGGGGIFRAGENMNLQILARQNLCHVLTMSEQIMYGSQ